MNGRQDDRREQEMRRILDLVERGELGPSAADDLLHALWDRGEYQDSSAASQDRPSDGPRPSPGRRFEIRRTASDDELPLEVRRLRREAHRLSHEAQRFARREVKESLREAKAEIKRAFRLSVAESRKAVKQVEQELQTLFSDAPEAPGPGSWLANLAGIELARDRVSHTAQVLLEQPAADVERIAVRNATGDVTISGWDEGRVEVRGRKTAWGIDREMAQDRSETMPLELLQRDREILVEARAPVPAGVGFLNLQRMRTNIVIMVPRHLSLLANTRSGDVAIDGCAGAVEVNTTSGDVVIDGLQAPAEVETTSGDIRLTACQGAGLALTTLSGDMSVSLSPQPQGDYRLRSANGDVVVRLNGEVNTDVSIETESGDISHGPGLSVVRREASRLRLRYPAAAERAPAGAAPAKMRVVTIKGDVSVG